MSRLSKKQIADHREAERLLTLDRLSDSQREFVLNNWQESATNINSSAGAFFTPVDLAPSVVCYINGAKKIIDLCAGIGCLGLHSWWHSNGKADVTCIELNPAYVAVGRKVFPEATWICASVVEATGSYDAVISNPPFGKTAKIAGPRYNGEDDLTVVDIASDLADFGTFILPSGSVPFEYSGRPHYSERPSDKYTRFNKHTSIELTCESTDAEFARGLWRGVAPRVEVASADFATARELRAVADMPLFQAA